MFPTSLGACLTGHSDCTYRCFGNLGHSKKFVCTIVQSVLPFGKERENPILRLAHRRTLHFRLCFAMFLTF